MIRRNTLLAGVSSGLKFCANALLLIALARVFGPEKFGLFSFAMTVAFFLGVIVDYGFNLQVVKEISQSPELVERETQKMIAGKLFLTITTLGIGFIVFLTLSLETAVLVLILSIAIILFSYGQFFFSILRAFNRFMEETRCTIIANVLLFVSVVVLLVFTSNIFLIAAVFLISRIVFFLLGAKIVLSEYKLAINKNLVDFGEIYSVLRNGFSYAVYMSSMLLFLSVDTFIINFVLGSESVGIYQSGIRFVYAALIISDTLMTVYLPVLSRSMVNDNAEFEKRAKQLIRVSVVIALPIGLALIIVPNQIVSLVLGNAYARTAELLPYFAVILLLRFLTISYGTLLTAKGLQNKRTTAIIVSLAIFASGAYWLIHRNGLLGVAVASIVAHVVMLGLFYRDMYSTGRQLYLEPKTVFMMILCAVAFPLAILLKPGLFWSLVIIAATSVFLLLIGLTRMEQKALLRTDWLVGKKHATLKN